jgi:hypothetical protein
VRSSTPSTSTWQHWGVLRAGQKSIGARLRAAAEERVAKAVRARVVSCIFDGLGLW